MLIVGERINTSRKGISPAVEGRDSEFIIDTAQKQYEAGAGYIDVNAGTLVEKEPEALEWLVKTVQGAIDVSLTIDSPNPVAIKRALEAHKGQAMINSITAEKERYENILPLVKEHKTKVIALAMDDSGIPTTSEGRLKAAHKLVDNLTSEGIALDDIYVDPLVYPIATGSHYGRAVLDTISTIRREYPGIHAICGLSNVSHGLPIRKLLNQAFLVMCMTAGLDAAIIDPLDQRLMALVQASDALLGNDEYCAEYIAASRQGKFEGIV
ncbi:MAG: methyltetrahydrofolate cobalamin methyltransferase [Armatimonadota bacterium]